MGVRGQYGDAVTHPGQDDVINKLPLTDEKTPIFDASNRLPYAKFHHEVKPEKLELAKLRRDPRLFAHRDVLPTA
jgi:hypothetical protein